MVPLIYWFQRIALRLVCASTVICTTALISAIMFCGFYWFIIPRTLQEESLHFKLEHLNTQEAKYATSDDFMSVPKLSTKVEILSKVSENEQYYA